ncbi:MAG: hypothetical protein PWQ50_2345 [Methanolobus sp.]|nr:hypothetical protein [Methanolobus sp.]
MDMFGSYNTDVFPFQILFYLLAGVVLYLVFSKKEYSDKVISGILAFFWVWMGAVFHLLYFAPINKSSYLFGILFIIQGVMFLKFGVLDKKLSFSFSKDIYGLLLVFCCGLLQKYQKSFL